jgi:general stress protein 26
MAFNHDEEIKDSYMMESIDSSRFQKIRDKNGG